MPQELIFAIPVLLCVLGETLLSKPVSGNKNSAEDGGTYQFVSLAWMNALCCNLIVYFCFAPDPRLYVLNVAAAGCCALAVALRVLSKRVLGKFYTMAVNIQADHQLITQGPYRYIRHPLYTGFTLLFLFWPLTQPSWCGVLLGELLGGIPVVAAILLRIKAEEVALHKRFETRWDLYTASTKKLIPWVY